MFLHRLPKFAHMLPANHPMCIKCQNRGQLKPTTMIYQLENAPLHQTTQGTPKTSWGALSWHIVSCLLQTGNCNKKNSFCVFDLFLPKLHDSLASVLVAWNKGKPILNYLTNFALPNKIFAFSSWWKFPFLQNGVKIKPELKKTTPRLIGQKNCAFQNRFLSWWNIPY